MDAKTTIDNTLLKDWKYYQKCKFENKIANAFPCNCYSPHSTMLHATLSFITQEQEPHIEVRRAQNVLTVKLSDIQGYNRDARNIYLKQKEAQETTLEFQTESIQILAFAELENFAREVIKEPSSESDD